MKLKAWFTDTWKALPALWKQTVSVARRTTGVLAPCALALMAMCLLETLTQAVPGAAGGGLLVSLLSSLAVTPVAAGMITYAAGASWEGRGAGLTDAFHLARIRIKEIVLTGLVAGLIVWMTGWIATTVYSLVGIIPALLGWIPLVGPAVTAAAALLIWLISLALEFVAHVALVTGMLSLTADGISGKAQIDRVLGILRSGGRGMIQELSLVLGLWILSHGAYALLFMMNPACAYFCDIAVAAATALSMTAVSVIYLKERDRQDGMKYHA